MTKKSMLKAFKGLAQETRLSIFLSLVNAGPEGMPAGQISDQFNLTGPTISFHLKALQQSGLVVSERRRQSIIYRANFDCITDLAEYFIANCCGGRMKTLAAAMAKNNRSAASAVQASNA